MAQQLDPALEQALRHGASVVTPSGRSARVLRERWATQRTSASVFDRAPEILPLEAWLAAQWHRRLLHGEDTRILLNRSQEHLLWRDIIAADLSPQNQPAEALAETAARAWSLLHRHGGREHLRELASTPDTRAFERWTRAFERRLARERLLTAAQLPAELASAPQTAPLRLALVDFDSLPPAVSRLVDAMQQSGTELLHLATACATHSAELALCSDDAHELQAAALWARAQLAADPAAQLAIVVPNLADRRADLDRAFSRTLAPERLPITASTPEPILEFSLGRPLAELPIAQTALDLLTWCFAPLPLERISALLLSPWFVSGDKRMANDLRAAEFDAFKLRQAHLLRPELTLDATLQLAGKWYRRLQGTGGLLHRLRTLRKAVEAIALSPTGEPPPRSFGEWSDLFHALLDAAGWSAHADSDSLSFQQHRRFETTLAELATLDLIEATPTFREAHAALARMLAQAVFAPESENAPVQIIGPLELGGIGFDALWFLGADDLAWPPSTLANPLLPFSLQQRHGIPGAGHARDDAQAASLTRRIAQAAPQVVFSYALRSDEGLRRPSALLAALELTELLPAAAPALHPRRLAPAAEDRTLNPLPPERTTGGTSLLALQAACAFRAFAEKRLWSSALDQRQPGFDAMERGNQVHALLEYLWSELKTQAALKSLAPAQRDALLERSIDHALTAGKATPPAGHQAPWEHAYLDVQRRRLRDLLRPWLELETRRPPFSVLPPEQKQQFALGPLTLNLRIDRIDHTPAGGAIVLDYKTGKASPKQWEGPRPDAPQMPLYAIVAAAAGHPLEGVAFALLRAGRELGLKGFADDPDAFGFGQKTDMMPAASLEDQIDIWRSVLTALAEAFAAGDTRVAPKSYPKTCHFCDQRLLCRLDPARLQTPDPDLDFEAEAEAEEEPAFG